MDADTYLQGKKVLVMGLGLVAGPANIAWLVRHGAEVTITDLWPRGTPKKAIEKLGPIADTVNLVIGEYRDEDFTAADIVMVNPSIAFDDPRLTLARDNGAVLENEASLFFRFCKNPILGVTGTRGKTTTTMWAHHFLQSVWPHAVLTGNVARDPLLAVLDGLDGTSPVAIELSSFQLEFLGRAERGPDVAVITNIMRDHLNRYKNMEAYVDAKTEIFAHQTPEDVLFLKKENAWRDYLLAKEPTSRLHYYDVEPLGAPLPEDFEYIWGAHNVENVYAAAHAANALGVPWEKIGERYGSLPHPPFRQEIIYERDGLMVVNDTTATTPDAGMAAINTFKGRGEVVLIAGGTDKELDFDKWAQVVQNTIVPKHLVLLEGSATEKMLEALGSSFIEKVHVCTSLEQCVEEALRLVKNITKPAVLLFSPAGSSFEKFTNEFDRGKQFNSLIQNYLPKGE